MDAAPEAAYLLRYLVCQFPGRAQHQCLDREAFDVELLQQPQAEGGSLAGAGLALADHIAPGQDRRQAAGLDRGHVVVVQRGEVGQQVGVKAERVESSGHVFVLGPWFDESATLVLT